MMFRRSGRGAWLLACVAGVAVAVVGLAGCTGGGATGTGDRGRSTEATSPLEEFTDIAYGLDLSPDEQHARAEAITRAYNEAIASCMADKGFDYEPGGAGGVYVMESTDLSDEESYGTVKYAQLYGYGLIDYPDASAVTGGDSTTPNPNADYVAAMTDSERAAYYAALEGEQPDPGEMTQEEADSMKWSPGGCRAEADRAVPAFGQSYDSPYADLEAAMSKLVSESAADPAMAGTNATWAQCMSDAGYPGYSAVGEPEDALLQQLNDIGSKGIPIDQDEATYPPLVELKAQEIAIATADFTCRESVGYEATRASVERQREQEFVDHNRAELTAWANWRAAAAQSAASRAASPPAG